ncbi:MAG: DUF4296 domain-containing protein [Altibacter sp.]|uniref:DUF4296 domain-containing protein n=1 Tax=Altibacter sp. TaxID=2024823 RepID=UPI001D89F88E|nr:DUF4296 domain-containing protein [Altibacter sp.]MBZ0327395.1 DUF4296 domain-containing protein [Altibacter sp.]
MRSFLYLTMVFVFMGCQDVKRPERPEDLIPRDKMVDIFTDAYVMNAARSINLKVITDNGVVLDSVFYTRYDIDSLQFVRSNAYYTANLNEYLSLFEEVEQRLLQLETKKDSIDLFKIKQAEAALEKDSIKAQSGLVDPVETDAN